MRVEQPESARAGAPARQIPTAAHVRAARLEPARPLREGAHSEQGIALIVALLSMSLMMALGLALMMTTMTEGKISSNHRDGIEARYAADAAIERVIQDILTVPDWNQILNGSTRSAFVDGLPVGTRSLPDGTQLNLTEATNMVNCGKVAQCTPEEMNANTDDRPWGLNNPRWQPYAYGPMRDMVPTDTINSLMYVVVWVGDDPTDNDNNPLRDGDPTAADQAPSPNPGTGVISMMAQAFGPGGVHRAIEVTLARTDTTEIERGYTGQRGQDEQNRRARKAAVQTPGKALTRATMSLSTGGVVTQ